MRYERLHDRQWLEREYCTRKRSELEIAQMLGCHQTSVAKALRRNGIVVDGNRRTWRSEDDERLCAMWAQGCLVKEIAQALGRNPGSVYGRIHHLKVAKRPPRSLYVRTNGHRIKTSPRIPRLNPRGTNFSSYGCLMALSDYYDARRNAA